MKNKNELLHRMNSALAAADELLLALKEENAPQGLIDAASRTINALQQWKRMMLAGQWIKTRGAGLGGIVRSVSDWIDGAYRWPSVSKTAHEFYSKVLELDDLYHENED